MPSKPNHPWRTRNSFTCPPNCPERKPACQDHCEHHLREKAEHNRKMEAVRLEKQIDSYAAEGIRTCRDIKAKRAKHKGKYIHGFE